MKFCYNTSFTLPNNPKDLDPSYKMDLEFWDSFGWEKKQNKRTIAVLYHSPETLLPIKCMANIGIVKLYNLKMFLVKG